MYLLHAQDQPNMSTVFFRWRFSQYCCLLSQLLMKGRAAEYSNVKIPTGDSVQLPSFSKIHPNKQKQKFVVRVLSKLTVFGKFPPYTHTFPAKCLPSRDGNRLFVLAPTCTSVVSTSQAKLCAFNIPRLFCATRCSLSKTRYEEENPKSAKKITFIYDKYLSRFIPF